jgi:chemotaxis receptor (MCP) glutamine deamidase CheD
VRPRSKRSKLWGLSHVLLPQQQHQQQQHQQQCWGLSHLLLPQQQQCWGVIKSSSSRRDLAVLLVLLLGCVWTSHT